MWEETLQTLLDSGRVAKAAILGLDGSTLAISPGLTVNSKEAQAVAAGISDPGPLYTAGLSLNGVKYLLQRAYPDRSLQGVKGGGGVHVVRSNSAILVGFYENREMSSDCALAVEKQADYLSEQGY